MAESDQREVAADSDAYVFRKRIDDDKEVVQALVQCRERAYQCPRSNRREGGEEEKKFVNLYSRSGPIEPTSREKRQTGRMEQGDPPCSPVSPSSYEKIEVYTLVVPSGKEKWFYSELLASIEDHQRS